MVGIFIGQSLALLMEYRAAMLEKKLSASTVTFVCPPCASSSARRSKSAFYPDTAPFKRRSDILVRSKTWLLL
jgi:hypothetical protein